MGEWREIPLGDLVKFSSGKTPSMSDPSLWGGQIPWISAKLMTDHKVKESSITITDKGLELGSKLAERGDILILVRGSGLFHDIPINWVEEPVAFNQDIKSVRAHDPELQEYIYYWLKSSKDYIYSILDTTGIGAGKFDTDLLRGLVVTMPVDADERRHLVETASALYAKIDLLHRQNKTLEGMAEALFRQWFVEEAEVGWRNGTLDECVELIIDHRGKTPQKLGSDWAEVGYPAISAKNVKEGKLIRPDTFKYVDEALYSRWMKEELREGDILMTSEAPLGELYFLISKEKYVLSQRLFGIRANSVASPYYLYSYLRSAEGQNELAGRASGTTVFGIRQTELRMVNLPIPPKALVDSFDRIVKPMYAKLHKNALQIERLTALRNTLLPKLMSGEVRVEQD
jgi:type I restriction enzyme S subunit